MGDDVPYWQVQVENALRSSDTEAWSNALVEAVTATQEAGMKYVG